ncbi:MAG: GIY-YIG nuclease family protein [Eggerthellaceae bacterium]|jgi:putative endonuclease
MCGQAGGEERLYYMYVAACADGTLYTGYARDVHARIAQHNAGTGAKYTRSRRPVRLAACAVFATQHEALSAEFRFKRLTRAQKLALMARAASEDDAAGAAAAEDGEWPDARARAFARVLSEAFPLQPDPDAPAAPAPASASDQTDGACPAGD